MDIRDDITQSAIVDLPYNTWTEMVHCDYDGDVVITDPCYLCHGVDKGETESGKGERWWEFAHKVLGGGGLMSTTFYGDWGCSVYKKSTNALGDVDTRKRNIIGNFCADAGMVCVVHLKDVLAYNPKFEEEFAKAHDWCVAIIRGFKGRISLWCKRREEGVYSIVDLRILGDGEKDSKPFYFEAFQTEM